jgi:hypothetical protein
MYSFFLIFFIDIELGLSSCESYCSGIIFSKKKHFLMFLLILG